MSKCHHVSEQRHSRTELVPRISDFRVPMCFARLGYQKISLLISLRSPAGKSVMSLRPRMVSFSWRPSLSSKRLSTRLRNTLATGDRPPHIACNWASCACHGSKAPPPGRVSHRRPWQGISVQKPRRKKCQWWENLCVSIETPTIGISPSLLYHHWPTKCKPLAAAFNHSDSSHTDNFMNVIEKKDKTRRPHR